MVVKLREVNGIDALDDLEGLDVSGWETPIKVAAEDAPWNQSNY